MDYESRRNNHLSVQMQESQLNETVIIQQQHHIK